MRIFRVISFALCIIFQPSAKNYRFIIGTYTINSPAKGIYSLKLSEKDLSSDIQLLTEDVNPSFMCFAKNKKTVYVANERADESCVSAYKFIDNSTQLQLVNRVNTGTNTDPCHIAMSTGHVLVANYSGGSVFVYKRQNDGSLSEVVQKLQHSGKGLHPSRQNKPHTHQLVFSPDGKFMLATELGVDKVFVYSYDKTNPMQPFSAFDVLSVKPGSGPRHLTFNKKGTVAYLLQELDGTISSIAFDKGKLSLLDTSSVVRNKTLQTGAADIHLSPDGAYLYASNRGTANDISCFKILPTGSLTFVQQLSTQGVGPRNFVISRDGKFVLIGNQRTNDISVFSRNKKNGELRFTGKKIPIGSPVCILEL